MASYVNFYENMAEALIRLKGTIVLYEGEPYYVWTVTNHKPDGIFRIYLTPIMNVMEVSGTVPVGNSVPHGHAQTGQIMDLAVDEKPTLILRKMMNSPAFNKFRPFPLGMCNQGANAVYITRQPTRPKTEQGLTQSMLFTSMVSSAPGKQGSHIDMYTEPFHDCIMGNYPSPRLTLENLTSQKYQNQSVAFHREFALCRGPLEMLFLAYRDELVGILPNNDFNLVRLGKNYSHTREVIEELNLFSRVE